VGAEPGAEDLAGFDAIVLCIGALRPRDMAIPGRGLAGIHLAMDYLTQQNRRVAGDDISLPGEESITGRGKHVVVLGGGDTSSDCIGNCAREGARSILNFIKYPAPPAERSPSQPWPFWPDRLRTTPAHEEGCRRHWGLVAKAFEGEAGRLRQVVTVDLEFDPAERGHHPRLREIPGTIRKWPAELVLIAIGFTGPQTGAIVSRYGLELTARGTLQTGPDFMSSVPGVFVAGDARMGASLIVWAIAEGREAARHVDRYLTGRSRLPTKGPGDLPRR
jgi:glutamate synthase (NADPH/NADH) small chain